jgi:hypothetical protein
MKRSVLILIAMILAAAAVGGGSFMLARRLCVQHLAAAGDDLSWLKSEFHLGDAEMRRIRALHEGYQPRCREICARIEDKQEELDAAMRSGAGVTPEVREKLAEVAALRAQCQANMLEHFFEVSKAMPPEQGERYLSEMRRLTLGYHEQIENSMAAHHHEHH